MADTKKCPFCAETIQREAIKCRYCGEKLAESGDKLADTRQKSGPWVIRGLVVIAVLFIIGHCSSQSDNTSTPTASAVSAPSSSGLAESASAPVQAPPPRPIQSYTAPQLYAMFHANEIKANQTIGNAIVRFAGIVDSVEQSNFSKTPELDIRADADNPYLTLRADLNESEISAAAELVKGQGITLQCDKVSMPVDVYASDCTIVAKSR